MHQSYHKGGLRMKLRNPVWKVRVGINTRYSRRYIEELQEPKYWKIKVILN